MKANWYSGVRKKDDPRSWRLLLGPYKTKGAADAMHSSASMLFSDLYPVEDLRGVVHATLKVKAECDEPGLLNHLLKTKQQTATGTATPSARPMLK